MGSLLLEGRSSLSWRLEVWRRGEARSPEQRCCCDTRGGCHPGPGGSRVFLRHGRAETRQHDVAAAPHNSGPGRPGPLVRCDSEWLWVAWAPRLRCAARVGRRRLVMRHAAGNDVRIETPVAIAVERPIVDDYGVVHSRDDIGPRCVGEEQAQVARIPPQVVGRELITASPIGEYPRPPGTADLVAREQVLRD